MNVRLRFTIASVLTLLALGRAHAETGVTDTEIVIGASYPETGPVASLGHGTRNGAAAYIKRINDAGGVNGRKIRVIGYDDHYQSDASTKNFTKLVEEDKVFAVFQCGGTQSCRNAVPIVSRANVPLVGVVSGGEFFRNPVNKNIFNIRRGYFQEVEDLITLVIDKKGINDIGLFIQDDSLGEAIKSAIVRALGMKHIAIKKISTVNKDAKSFAAEVAEMKSAGIKAVVLGATHYVSERFMRESHTSKFKPLFVGFNAMAENSILKNSVGMEEELYITTAIPPAVATDYKVVREFQTDMKAAGFTDLDIFSIEGYLNSMVLVKGLELAGKDLTREKFRTSLEGIRDYDLGGVSVSYSPSNHQGILKSFVWKVKDGKLESVAL